jgi:hypothetical protein
MTHITTKPQGVWAWILQRVTAVLLVVFLGTHLFVLHYIPDNMNINFLGVAARFKSVLYLVIDSGLLAVVSRAQRHPQCLVRFRRGRWRASCLQQFVLARRSRILDLGRVRADVLRQVREENTLC